MFVTYIWVNSYLKSDYLNEMKKKPKQLLVMSEEKTRLETTKAFASVVKSIHPAVTITTLWFSSICCGLVGFAVMGFTEFAQRLKDN